MKCFHKRVWIAPDCFRFTFTHCRLFQELVILFREVWKSHLCHSLHCQSTKQALAGVQLQTSQSLLCAVLAGNKESRTALLWAPVGGFAKRRRLWDSRRSCGTPGGAVKEPIKRYRHFCKSWSSNGCPRPWWDDASHCLPYTNAGGNLLKVLEILQKATKEKTLWILESTTF